MFWLDLVCAQLAAFGEVLDVECDLKRRTGEPLPVRLSIPVNDPESEPVDVMVNWIEASHLKIQQVFTCHNCRLQGVLLLELISKVESNRKSA